MLMTKNVTDEEDNIRKRRRMQDNQENELVPPLGPPLHSADGFVVAPDFRCAAVCQDSFTRLQLSAALSDVNAVILFFYGCDFTPAAQSDLDLISSHFDSFCELQAMPIAISADTEAVHHAFLNHPSKGLTKRPEFPLVADTTRALAQSFDVLDIHTGVSKRSAFIIDKKRQIRFSFVLGDDRIAHSMGTIMTMLRMIA